MNYSKIKLENSLFSLSSIFGFFLFFCFFLWVPFSAKATHIVGGEIGYKCLGGNQYEITLRVFRDCFYANPDAFFDDPAIIGIYASNGFRLNNLSIKPMGNDTLREGIDSCYKSFINNICVHTTTYKTIVNLPFRAGGYHLVYQRCCRNETIVNIINPKEAGATYDILISEAALQKCNSSPTVNSWPPVYVCANQELNVNSSGFDNEGDSLAYRLCAPLIGGTLARPQPIPPTGPPFQPINWLSPTYSLSNILGGGTPLTIDVSTGIMKGIPPVLGQFVVGVCIDEFDKISKNLLSTTRRDFQYNVVNCTVPQATFEAPNAVCVGTNLALKNNVANAKSVEWYQGDLGSEVLIGKGDSTNYSFKNPGKTRITLYFERGTACQSTYSVLVDVVKVEVETSPIPSQLTKICKDNLLSIKVTNKDISRSLTFNWAPLTNLISGAGTSSVTYKINQPQTISLNLTNSLGCKDSLLFPVSIYDPLIPNLDTSLQICSGIGVESSVNFNKKYTYKWTPVNGLSNPNIGNPVITLLKNETYTVKVSNPETGCDTTITVKVTIKPFGASPNLDSVSTVCYDLSKQINPNLNKSLKYTWRPSTGLSDSTIGNPFVKLKNSITYQVYVQNPLSGCDTTITVKVTIKPFGANPNLDSVSTVCYDVSKQINPNLNKSLKYTWRPSTGLSDSTIGNPFVKLKNSTTYQVYVQNPLSGCDTTVKVRIEVSPMLPVVELDTTLDFCPDIPKKVNLPNSSLVTYLWTPTTGLDNPNVSSPTFTLSKDQTYTVKITDPRTNCNLVWKVNALVSPKAVISAGKDTTLCQSMMHTLRGTSSLPLTYQWTKSTDPLKILGTNLNLRDSSNRGETFYILRATDAKGCFWLDTTLVRSVPVLASIPANYVVCKPTDLTTIRVMDNDVNQMLSYLWTPSNILTSDPIEGPNAIAKINTSTSVSVNLMNKWGCEKILKTQLELIDLKIDLSADKVTLIKGNNEISTITASGCSDCTYNWSPSTGLTSTNVPSVVRVSPQDTTIYKVVATQKGCSVEKSIRINVDNVNCGEPNIFVPNAFTPNNDGSNDILKVRGRWISKLQFVVYNRWGQEMFTTNDLNNGWNGTFKGNDVAPDVYNYFLQVTCLDNKIFTKRGNTSIIK